MATLAPIRSRGGRNRLLTTRYAEELSLFRTGWAKAGLAAVLAVYVLAPFVISGFWLTVLCYAGITAIGAIGLNLLTGYTGQISLGHAAFVGAGAYACGYLGTELELPLPVWLLGAAIVGGVLGAVIGPFALRLRGLYLVIVTLGLVFVAEHVFNNWDDLTGGGSGRSTVAPSSLGPLDFEGFTVLGVELSRDGGYFLLIWGLVALVALMAKNIVRTRPGRAMQAVRDRDLAAEVIGVNLARYKIGAFVVSSALAGVAGALFASYQRFVSPEEFDLFLSIQYLAIIIVGGLGTIFGAIIGALFLGTLPRIIEEFSGSIPGVATTAGGEGFITVFALNQAIFGALIIAFLVFEPRGLAAIWLRAKTYFKSWPFSY